MHIESLQKKIKYYYLEGVRNKRRLDSTIKSLFELIRDIGFERLIKIAKKVLPRYDLEIISRHIKGSKICDIVQINDSKWQVESETMRNEIYNITKNKQCTCSKKFDECDVCAHAFSCTCKDYLIGLNTCKHIPAIMLNKNQMNN